MAEIVPNQPAENRGPDEFFDVEDNPPDALETRRYSRLWKHALIFIAGTEIFLAPITILVGGLAKESEPWRFTFIILFLSWLLLLVLGVLLDLGILPRPRVLKRSLWHLGSCSLAFYFFAAVLQITSDNLPQWIPTIIDCGIGVSCGLQSIPPDSLRRLGQYIIDLASSICGAAQVHVHSTAQVPPEPLLPYQQTRVERLSGDQLVQERGLP